jgi:hypothetical protein
MPGQIVFKKGRYGNTEVVKDLAVKVHKKIPPPPPTGRRDKE